MILPTTVKELFEMDRLDFVAILPKHVWPGHADVYVLMKGGKFYGTYVYFGEDEGPNTFDKLSWREMKTVTGYEFLNG